MKLSDIKITKHERGVEVSSYEINEAGPAVDFGQVLEFKPVYSVDPTWKVEFPFRDSPSEFECPKSELLVFIEDYCVDFLPEEELPEEFRDD